MVDGLPGENMKEMRVNDEQIGDSFPTYVVAEAGLNHNGDVETAKKMIESVKNSGVNAIKFQTYKTNNFLTDDSEYYDFFKNVELSFEEFKELKEYSDNLDITFFSAPFDFESADYLKKINNPNAHKLKYKEVAVTIIYNKFGQGLRGGLRILKDLIFHLFFYIEVWLNFV